MKALDVVQLVQALKLCKQKLLHTQSFMTEKVNLYIFFYRFKKAFESEPTLQSGINYAVLLLAAGYQFESSFELRKVGNYNLIFYMEVKKLWTQLGTKKKNH